jgi:hypothetical protein
MQVKKIYDEEDKYSSVLHVNIAIECSTCIPTYIHKKYLGYADDSTVLMFRARYSVRGYSGAWRETSSILDTSN